MRWPSRQARRVVVVRRRCAFFCSEAAMSALRRPSCPASWAAISALASEACTAPEDVPPLGATHTGVACIQHWLHECVAQLVS